MDFKVKCVRVKRCSEYFTEGKIYDVTDGVIWSDNGVKFDTWGNPYYSLSGENRDNNFESLKEWFSTWYDFELVEDKKVFTKKDLKTGDFVLRANGVEGVFIEHLGAFVSKDGFMPLSKVNDDLTHTGCDNGWDIVTVRRPTQVYHCQFNVPRFGDIVYNRKRDTKPLYNGKVVCLDATINQNLYTVGKIYQFKDGRLTGDNGKSYPEESTFSFDKIYTFEDWKNWSSSKWLEIKE